MTDGKTGAQPEKQDFPFTNRDVVGLINALSKMAGNLTKGQWGLLLSILAAAAGNVEVSENKTMGKFSGVQVDGGVVTSPRNKDVKELREQLQKAYMPDKEPRVPLKDIVIPPKKTVIPPNNIVIPSKGAVDNPPPRHPVTLLRISA